MNPIQPTTFVLKIQCPDQKGLLAAVSQAIAQAGGNILQLWQHTATDLDLFFMRAKVDAGVDFDHSSFAQRLDAMSGALDMKYEIHDFSARPKVGLLVSKTSHCLYELLIKHREGDLPCEFPCVISNHADLATVAAQFGVPFYHVPTQSGKEQHESQVDQILRSHGCEWVVLARYMQVLSKNFTDSWDMRVLNIHHGFLPAFQGAKPYHQAWSKGVKMIGATAHFANEDLDQGPIVEQDVKRVSDRSSIAELVQVGKDVERKVLLQGLQKLLNHQVFCAAGRTFIVD
jgi:formyltetrahydrofolate deformylase